MRNLTIFPMSSYKGKLFGLVLLAVSLILSAIVKIYGALPFIHNLDSDKQFGLFLGLTGFGMYQTAYSKEKNDDERVQRIRARSMQSAFMLLAGTMLAIFLTSVTGHRDVTFDNIELCALAMFGLGFYLVLFHIGLYFDPSWNYNDDTVFVNIRKNKRFFIFYLIGVLVFFALVILIHHA